MHCSSTAVPSKKLTHVDTYSGGDRETCTAEQKCYETLLFPAAAAAVVDDELEGLKSNSNVHEAMETLIFSLLSTAVILFWRTAVYSIMIRTFCCTVLLSAV